jgi:hypothetical protein
VSGVVIVGAGVEFCASADDFAAVLVTLLHFPGEITGVRVRTNKLRMVNLKYREFPGEMEPVTYDRVQRFCKP